MKEWNIEDGLLACPGSRFKSGFQSMCCYASVILWILLLSLKPRALCCSGTVHRLSFVAIVVLSKQSVLVGDCYISRTQREIASIRFPAAPNSLNALFCCGYRSAFEILLVVSQRRLVYHGHILLHDPTFINAASSSLSPVSVPLNSFSSFVLVLLNVGE
ncbi:hypothetical protein GGU10DRAFT_339535 [Lentinula aff. detonsa]|uniref:Uncharacterized protein n=1 Tax=Lentinula aff. detonsa TaxID=2804958 RepID=A0AA38NTC7_9AGAR|nr:hypothetical protein GGU10DRAFT_339535 [Lentinula aff. detonsa]